MPKNHKSFDNDVDMDLNIKLNLFRLKINIKNNKCYKVVKITKNIRIGVKYCICKEDKIAFFLPIYWDIKYEIYAYTLF